jgi:cysteinyl-tRNA synthetase
MKLYNTLTRSVQEFVPLKPPAVTIYVCGPTVYDDPHIGHARSAFVFDVLRRYLRSKQYDVTFVRNVTDVDDKIIQKARKELGERGTGNGERDLKTACLQVAERYLKSYHETMDQLGIERPTEEPRATTHIDGMLDLISKLVLNKDAYEAGGDVYFSVRKFGGYGKLSNRTLDDLKSGARVEPGEHKEDPLDFALWKAAKPEEPSWKSPWGEGRPGWHIECSAMSTKYLGDAFDIHGGGVDLVFPHHENEIAQAQAAGKPFAKYWIHNGLLTVNGEKMSKSLGNFITVEQALKDAGHVDVLKMFFLGSHYRSPVDYTKRNIKSARKRFDGLTHLLDTSNVHRAAAKISNHAQDVLSQIKEEFTQAMDDDLNTPKALASIDKLANFGYQSVVGIAESGTAKPNETAELRGNIVAAREMLLELGKVLGLFHQFEEVEVPAEIATLVERREQARRSKDFETADRLRKTVESKGFVIEDTSDGPLVLRKR